MPLDCARCAAASNSKRALERVTNSLTNKSASNFLNQEQPAKKAKDGVSQNKMAPF